MSYKFRQQQLKQKQIRQQMGQERRVSGGLAGAGGIGIGSGGLAEAEGIGIRGRSARATHRVTAYRHVTTM